MYRSFIIFRPVVYCFPGNTMTGNTMSRKLPDYMTKDQGSGYVYLMEAEGFHGVLSPWLKRCKIGLSNNPERRLRELNSEQAPCRVVGIRYIKVLDNARTEKQLHRQFAINRKHGEWFDFWIWELPKVNKAFDKAKRDDLGNLTDYRKLIKIALVAICLSFGVSLTASLILDSVKSLRSPYPSSYEQD